MAIIAEFERELYRKSPPTFATWHSIDLHNHSPASFDYEAGGENVLERSAQQILARDLAAVMFTDHVRLPDAGFVDELQRRTGRLILRGVELNVFVDAWTKPLSKITKNLYFHLLIGFDPDATETPDYWITHLYKRCHTEERQSGGTAIKGVTDSIDRICEELQGSNAIVIPAHLHSDHNAFASRSVDDIYADPEFLKAAKKCFTCLEVTDPKTAEFFDGKHQETNNLELACIRSSDSHSPEQLGVRPCYAQMEQVTFAELKHALELPFRVKLKRPDLPSAYIVGLQITGKFFSDLWLSLSPNCNVFMGVKGSGKTSVLECLRFVLGVEVPESRTEEVNGHLNAILGPGGSVKALVKRADGARVLVQRTLGSNQYALTFEDDRQQVVSSSDPIQFPAAILGWHEIEQAATDSRIRKVYLDAISGREAIRQHDVELKSYSQRIHATHDTASSKLKTFRDSQSQVSRLRERREGLQKLKDASLVALKEEYETAIRHRDLVATTQAQLALLKSQLPTRFAQVLAGINAPEFDLASPLKQALLPAAEAIRGLVTSTESARQELDDGMQTAINALDLNQANASVDFA
ncbi:AAA family ATPase [Stieleria magnilauensis]|uniref:Rad50/SbcC-type AAA domain-containing protein n=1 Tax=Stieleria magnilauensis TaxID=2527963 RepID=A0ABX5Y5G1_9BACT|nr:hypothetical protein TBK1r_63840 [Planctomycetes bacterium TBK1r]